MMLYFCGSILKLTTMKILPLVLFYLLSIATYGQYQMDLVTRESPERTIAQKIGFTEIAIKYSSPMVKNRTIWGELLPYDKVWRAGANWATTISFSESVNIEGQAIASGIYSLLLIPKEKKKWVIILNSVHRQWGAFKYDSSKDVIRVEVIPQIIPKEEKLRFEIDNYSSQLALVQLKWDKVLLQLPIEIDMVQPLDSLLVRKSAKLSNDVKWVAYLQAAELLLEENQGLKQALKWVEESEKLAQLEMEWNKQYYPKAYILGHLYWTKAKILGALGNKKGALIEMEKMKNLSNPVFYKKESAAEEMEKWTKEWSN